jgi:hypothetical protein
MVTHSNRLEPQDLSLNVFGDSLARNIPNELCYAVRKVLEIEIRRIAIGTSIQ